MKKKTTPLLFITFILLLTIYSCPHLAPPDTQKIDKTIGLLEIQARFDQTKIDENQFILLHKAEVSLSDSENHRTITDAKVVANEKPLVYNETKELFEDSDYDMVIKSGDLIELDVNYGKIEASIKALVPEEIIFISPIEETELDSNEEILIQWQPLDPAPDKIVLTIDSSDTRNNQPLTIELAGTSSSFSVASETLLPGRMDIAVTLSAVNTKAITGNHISDKSSIETKSFESVRFNTMESEVPLPSSYYINAHLDTDFKSVSVLIQDIEKEEAIDYAIVQVNSVTLSPIGDGYYDDIYYELSIVPGEEMILSIDIGPEHFSSTMTSLNVQEFIEPQSQSTWKSAEENLASWPAFHELPDSLILSAPHYYTSSGITENIQLNPDATEYLFPANFFDSSKGTADFNLIATKRAPISGKNISEDSWFISETYIYSDIFFIE